MALALAGWLCAGASAWAQPGPPPGGFSFGPMPGPNMFARPPAVSVTSQYSRLLGMPTVQNELKLTEEQIAKIQDAGDKMRAAERELFSGFREMKEEERRAKMEEIGKKQEVLQEERKAVIEQTLQPQQLERLKAISLQVLGAPALQDVQVRRDLELSSAQAAAIQVVSDRSRKKMGDLFKPGADWQAARTKSDELRKDTEKQVLALLTDAQRAALEKMKGAVLEIPSSEMFGFGGPGGRGFGRSRGPGGDDRRDRGRDRPAGEK